MSAITLSRPKAALAALAIIVGSSVMADPSYAQTSGSDCGIEQAADAALQQQIAMIDAAKVNVPEFFSGANSCISPDLFKSFDLSSLIPDLGGFMSGGLDSMAQDLINQAKTQVCKILDEQLSKMMDKMKSSLSQFNGGLGSQLSSILGGSTGGLNLPDVSGIGQYDFSSMGTVTGETQSGSPSQALYEILGNTTSGGSSSGSTGTVPAPITGSGTSGSAGDTDDSGSFFDNVFGQ